MMSTADRLVLRVRGNPVTLDALAQWAMTPVQGSTPYPPDHTLILRNLVQRFGITPEQAAGRYDDLQDAVAAVGLDFPFGFLTVRDDLVSRLLADGTLAGSIADRIGAASSRERAIAWLFCRSGTVAGPPGAGEGFESFLPRFLALLRATFDMSASAREVQDVLVRTGCLNELEATIEDYPHVIKKRILVPSVFAPDVWETVQTGIDPPRPPDFAAYLERRISRRMLTELIALEEILDRGVVRADELSGEITAERGLVEERDGCIAVNAVIADEGRELLLAAKDRIAAGESAAIERALESVYERRYPSFSYQRRDLWRGVTAWEIAPADGRDDRELVIVHAPWLTGPQLRRVAAMALTRSVVLVCSGIMGIPEAERLLQRLAPEASGNGASLVLADLRPGRRATRVHGEKPGLYDEWFAAAAPPVVRESGTGEAPVRAADPEAPRPMDAPCSGSAVREPERFSPEPTTGAEETGAAVSETDAGGDELGRYLVEHIPPRPDGLHVFLGTTDRGEEISWSPGDLLNGHFIIIGGSGAGKTETIRCISSELDRQGYPVLLIDFHGDMANSTGYARTYEIREGGSHYFNPLDLDRAFSEITPLRATSDFVDAIFINFPTLGIQQREHLVEIISGCYAQAGITAAMRTWERELKFGDIRAAITASDDKTTQTIRAYMGDIFRYNLFQSSEKISISRVLDGGITHLNLRALPESLRSLYADLILRKLYYSVQSLGEIPRGEVGDHDRFRIFVIVDEAKLLVGEKQGIKAVLNKYATELRKFGVGIILASQLVGHFNDEILANIAVKFCMKAETKRQARENCKYFEFDERQLLTLRQGEGILVSGDDRRKIRIVPTWERPGDEE